MSGKVEEVVWVFFLGIGEGYIFFYDFIKFYLVIIEYMYYICRYIGRIFIIYLIIVMFYVKYYLNVGKEKIKEYRG